MKFPQLLLTLLLVLLAAGTARADLDGYLSSLNLHASTGLGAFRADLGAHFGASGSEVDLVLRSVNHPGEAAVCFWLRQHSGQPLAVVLRSYRERQGQGWGELAKSLGIKPGSAEFHALKAGELGWYPAAGGEAQGGKSLKKQDKGKAKGKEQ